MTDEERFCNKRCRSNPCRHRCEYVSNYLDGLEEGRKEKWHYVKDGDIPKDEDYKLCITDNGNYYIARYEELFITWSNQEHKEVCCPYAWKEIVLPKEIKEK